MRKRAYGLKLGYKCRFKAEGWSMKPFRCNRLAIDPENGYCKLHGGFPEDGVYRWKPKDPAFKAELMRRWQAYLDETYPIKAVEKPTPLNVKHKKVHSADQKLP